ncbi:TMhelix containing protein [Vibrio phage 1.118.B._10N.261.49.F6]|nr:TMhelix containing protein [Vibrio phage 1.118.A._10N.261.49.F6]AUR88861.1 TMhelix containing protein [Vibrio phage 1.118.B._10N.261.49.F6]
MSRHDAATQQEWRHEVTDWETKRADEAAPLIKLSLSVIAVALIGLYVLDSIALEISRW